MHSVSYPETEGLDQLAPLDVKPQSLSGLVYDSIRSSIVAKRLAPGTVVSEVSLARRLGVSKTPVREALLRLQSIGLVEQDGGRGLRVVSPSSQGIWEAFEVRMVLEGGLCRSAASLATSEQLDEIVDAARESRRSAEAGDVNGFRQWDHVFHRAIRAAAGNSHLARLSEDAVALASVLRERDVPEVQDAIRCGEQHDDIAGAIARRDESAAIEASNAHVTFVRDMVLSAFEEQSRSASAAMAHR